MKEVGVKRNVFTTSSAIGIFPKILYNAVMREEKGKANVGRFFLSFVERGFRKRFNQEIL